MEGLIERQLKDSLDRKFQIIDLSAEKGMPRSELFQKWREFYNEVFSGDLIFLYNGDGNPTFNEPAIRKRIEANNYANQRMIRNLDDRTLSAMELVRFASGLDRSNPDNDRYCKDVINLQTHENGENFDPNNEKYIALRRRLMDEYSRLNGINDRLN